MTQIRPECAFKLRVANRLVASNLQREVEARLAFRNRKAMSTDPDLVAGRQHRPAHNPSIDADSIAARRNQQDAVSGLPDRGMARGNGAT